MKNMLILLPFVVILYVTRASAEDGGLLDGLLTPPGKDKTSSKDKKSADKANGNLDLGKTVDGLLGGLIKSPGNDAKKTTPSSGDKKDLTSGLNAVLDGVVQGGTGSVKTLLGSGLLEDVLKEVRTLGDNLPDLLTSLGGVLKDLPILDKAIPILVKGLPVID